MYFNFQNDIWDLIQKSYPTGYCPDIYHPVTQSDSLKTKINYLQHKRQNVTVEVSVKGKRDSYSPEESVAPRAPPPRSDPAHEARGKHKPFFLSHDFCPCWSLQNSGTFFQRASQ